MTSAATKRSCRSVIELLRLLSPADVSIAQRERVGVIMISLISLISEEETLARQTIAERYALSLSQSNVYTKFL